MPALSLLAIRLLQDLQFACDQILPVEWSDGKRVSVSFPRASLRRLHVHARVALDRIRPPRLGGGSPPPAERESHAIIFLSTRKRPASAEHTPSAYPAHSSHE